MSGGEAPKKNDLEARLAIASHLPPVALLSALAVVGTLAVVGAWPAVSRAGRDTATAGPVSNHHRLIEARCESCHAQPFGGASDVQCTTCHQVNEHAVAMPKMFEAHPDRRLRCASCHKEHHGLRSLVPVDSPLCTGCHAEIGALLPGTRQPSIASFARHPELGPRKPGLEPSSPAPRDPTRLKFSHAEHLQAHPAAAHPEALECASCHVPIADQSVMQPISFAKHCESCHALTLDGRLAGLHVPHGSPDGALAVIRAELARSYVGLASPSPAPDAGAPGVEESAAPTPVPEALATEALDLEQALYTEHRGCEKCHDVTAVPPAPGKSRYAVVDPRIPSRWLPASKFAHGPHRTTPCRDCHVSAEPSTTAGDILIPAIARCRECHADPGVDGKIESPCLECHRYHAVHSP